MDFWIDVGGTFTDCIALLPDGSLRVHKLLSSGAYKGRAGEGSTRTTILDPERRADPPGFFSGFTVRIAGQEARVASFDAASGSIILDKPLRSPPVPGTLFELVSGEEAPVTGIRHLLAIGLHEPLGPVRIRLGTTRGTNALLEHLGAPTAFVTTRGFGDVLRIAYQNRPRIFDLAIRKPVSLCRETVEVDERIDHTGAVLMPLDETAARKALRLLPGRGIRSLAVCLMHAYRNPVHEERLGELAGDLGFEQISLSHRLAPSPKIVSRGDTTVVDAYLSPVIRSYVAGIRAKAPEARIHLMTSAGALTDAAAFVGKDSIFSGPAGGVVGFARVAGFNGFGKAVGFDMGGTSTDVSRFDGEFERRFEMEVSAPDEGVGVRVLAPMLAIETVAAGGGSICRFDGQKPVVGPESAGADPGPACYGRGGPLTVTDVNFVLGRILPDRFAFPLDRGASLRALDALVREIEERTGVRYAREILAEGFRRIANANMAAPIKKISLARGIDVREYVLVSFGGAGGQHACAVARSLGMKKVLVPPLDGVLSAYGIGSAAIRRFGERHLGATLGPDAVEAAGRLFLELEASLRLEVLAEGIPESRILPSRRLLDLRYRRQDTALTVPDPGDGNWRDAFESTHRDLYGFAFPDRDVEIVAVRAEVTGASDAPAPEPERSEPRIPRPLRAAHLYAEGSLQEAGVFLRESLRPGDQLTGPALVLAPIGTTVVDPGFRAELTPFGDLLLSDETGPPGREELDSAADPIALELFNNHFASIAEQMGTLLQKTAVSVNVKERFDFSCALFDSAGELVVNAPHIPVHLGSMGECVKALLEDVPDLGPGDVFVTNDPYRGGSHLPDVTVVTPIFEIPNPKSQIPKLLFFAASRAHHAEIGGVAPGSMPARSGTLGEEGVVIRHFRLVQDDRSSEEELRRLLTSGPHPSRSPGENIADINAASAANRLGTRLLGEMIERFGLETVRAYTGHIRRAASDKMRESLLGFPPGSYRFEDALDDGTPLAVCIDIRHGVFGSRPEAEATVDFAGTGSVLPGNLNANAAIVASAVLYCFRTLIGEEIPLNGGILEPIRIVLPECLLNPAPAPDPTMSPAVAGGNVETSQRVVDAIFGALGVAAASQGTMNNLTFGNDRFGYYETMGGGAGAGEGFEGADAVHVHMTNTRLTDPEILEARYPVRLRRFAVRRGSGGLGRFRGGDGIIREIEFLEPVHISLLTQRRTRRPWGLNGGGAGMAGVNLFVPKDGEPEILPPICERDASPGDVLVIETPGGGAYGAPAE